MPMVALIGYVYDMDELTNSVADIQLGVVNELRTDLTRTPVLDYSLNIGMKGDTDTPDPVDVLVLAVNRTETIVVADYRNKCIKSLHTKDRKLVGRLSTGNCPWSLTKLSGNQVAVSVPMSNQILIVDVQQDLLLVSTITTSRMYWGLTAFSGATLAAGSNFPSSIDILDMAGNILSSVSSLSTGQNLIQSPSRLFATTHDNILVSDVRSFSVFCMTKTGSLVFAYTPTGDRALDGPRSVIASTHDSILIADESIENLRVVEISRAGHYIKDILTGNHGLRKEPCGLSCDHQGHIYVTHRGQDTSVFQLK